MKKKINRSAKILDFIRDFFLTLYKTYVSNFLPKDKKRAYLISEGIANFGT